MHRVKRPLPEAKSLGLSQVQNAGYILPGEETKTKPVRRRKPGTDLQILKKE